MEPEPTYTVFIRVPFERGNFVDPPLVNWDSSKDEALWKILSGVAKTDIDWEGLAGRFEVTVDFLLQQATYLQERHNTQLRAQMRKATAAKSSAPSPIPPEAPTAEAMRRTGSTGGRAPSSLSIRRESGVPRMDGPNTPGTPGPTSRPTIPRPQNSRTASSSNTTVLTGQQRLAGTASPRPDPKSGRPNSPQRRRLSSLPIQSSSRDESPPGSPGPADSTSDDAEESSSSEEAQSRIIRRPPRRVPAPDTEKSPWDAESEESEPAFLPFKARPDSAGSSSGKSVRGGRDLSATLRGDPRALGRRLANVNVGGGKGDDSSAGEGSSAATPSAVSRGGRVPDGPLSPRRTAELAGRSPAGKKGYSREGSDGTPSMGSSFSDLDDASVTQSALEEALLSNMKDGMGSRISNFSQAIKSRYLPKGNNNP